jgi:hypothetical protein
MRSKRASKERKENAFHTIPFHCIKSTRSSSTDREIIIPDDERVIDNCGADERRKKLAVELGDGMGDLAGG